MTALPPNTYRLAQSQFNAVPGKPWVYWVSEPVRKLFETLPTIGDIDPPREGINTGNNERFVFYWWEIGHPNSGKEYVPFVKGAPPQGYFDRINEVLRNKIEQIRLMPGAALRNQGFAFQEAVAFVSNATGGFRARFIPAGCMFCSTGGRAIFPSQLPILGIVGLLNSSLAKYLLGLINPTVTFTVGDIASIPIAKGNWLDSMQLSTSAIRWSHRQTVDDETTFDFIAPPRWSTGLQDLARAQSQISNLESQIDDEVYRLYGIGPEDRAAIEAELSSGQKAEGSGQEAEDEPAGAEGEEDITTDAGMTRQELAVRWVSYAVGIVLGRFQPGVAGALGSAVYRREDFAIGSLPAPGEEEFDELVGSALTPGPSPDWKGTVGRGESRFAYVAAEGGRHVFPADVEKKLRALADADGIMVLDEGHPDDLPKKVETALELMLGEQGAADVIAEIGGDPSAGSGRGLRWFLERDFFSKWHVRWYQKRPIYWLLQSPKKLYGVYLFHERITKDTLFVVQRKYLDAKINLTRQLLAEKRAAAKAEGAARERRALNKQADDLEKLLTDLDEFAKRLKAITEQGYDPDINDGVILNLAPLWEVIPAWSKEPLKYWEGLERGEYDWAHIAMKHWPERVRAKCRTDKSLAIAHGLTG